MIGNHKAIPDWDVGSEPGTHTTSVMLSVEMGKQYYDTFVRLQNQASGFLACSKKRYMRMRSFR